MREAIAVLVLYVASLFIDIESGEADFISGLALLVCLGTLIFLAAALAERLSPKFKTWFRITPGRRTELDEKEWERIGQRRAMTAEESAVAAPLEKPPEAKQEAVFYDSGFEDSVAKKKPEGPDSFDEIFGDKKDESSP